MAVREPERYFDRRTIKRHVKRGHVSESDYQRFLESLPDVSENIMPHDDGGDEDGFDGSEGEPAAVSPGASVGGLGPAPLGGPLRPSIGSATTFDDDSDDLD